MLTGITAVAAQQGSGLPGRLAVCSRFASCLTFIMMHQSLAHYFDLVCHSLPLINRLFGPVMLCIPEVCPLHARLAIMIIIIIIANLASSSLAANQV